MSTLRTSQAMATSKAVFKDGMLLSGPDVNPTQSSSSGRVYAPQVDGSMGAICSNPEARRAARAIC